MRRRTRFISMISSSGESRRSSSGPALVLYTTPPLDSKGTRIQLLIPHGWKRSYLSRAGAEAIDDGRSMPWLPDWANNLISHDGLILIGWSTSTDTVPDTPDYFYGEWPAVFRARSIRGGNLTMFYWRPDRKRFRDSYRQILDSVKIL